MPTPSSPAIRPATPDDIPAVLPMVAAIIAEHETWDPERYTALPDVLDRYARWLPARITDPSSIFLVAEDGADDLSSGHGSPSPPLLAFLVASAESNIPIYTAARYGFIHDLWVEPHARRRGIARALLTEAIARFAAMGLTQVRLETAAANDPARRLFASAGFRTATVDMLLPLPSPPPSPPPAADHTP